MKTLYLHIGTSKTGTTSIQNFLYNNKKILKKQGYIYPDFGTRYFGVAKVRNAHFLVLEETKINKDYAEALKKIDKVSRKYNSIIMSEESLWNISKNIKRFVEDMKIRNINVKLIVYLRRQDLYVQSHWAQRVKEGFVNCEFKDYIKTLRIKLDYYEHCCKLRDIVGKDNFTVRVYEKQQFLDNNLLADFSQAVGLKCKKEILEEQRIKNLSLGGIYLDIKRRLNKYPEFNCRGNFIKHYLFQIAEEDGETEKYSINKFFTYNEQLEFLSKYNEGNEKLAREFLKRTDGNLFYDKIIENEKQNMNFTLEEYVDVFSKIILKQQRKIYLYEKIYNIEFFRRIKRFLRKIK